MQNRISNYLSGYGNKLVTITLVICLLLSIGFYLFPGYYLEDHSALLINLQSGYLTGGIPYADFYVYCQTFIGPVYAFLHSLVQPVPWISLTHYFCLFVSSVIFCAGVLFVIKKALPAIGNGWLAVLGAVFFILVMADNYVFFSMVRVSFIATAAAFIGLMWLVRQQLVGLKFLFLYGFFFVLFLIGFLTRFESGLGACLVIGVCSLLLGESIRRLLIIYLPAALFCIFTLVYLHYQTSENPFLNAIEPDVYLLSDAKYNPDFYSGKSPVDSMRYLAVLKYIINDEGTITPELIKTMIKEKMQIETAQPSFISHSVAVAVEIVMPVLTLYPQLFCFNLVLLLLAIAVYYTGFGSGRFLITYISYQFFFWAIIFALAYLVKMETRIYMPLIGIYAFGNVILLFKADINTYAKIHSRHLALAAFVFISLGGWFTVSLCVRGYQQAKITRLHNQVIDEIGRIGTGKMVLLDVDSRIFVHSTPFTLVQYPTVKNIFLYDAGQLAVLNGYKQFLDNACNCNSGRMADFYEFLFAHKEQVLFVSRQDRIDLLKSYLKIVHGANYEFIKVVGNFKVEQVVEGSGGMSYYTFN